MLVRLAQCQVSDSAMLGLTVVAFVAGVALTIFAYAVQTH